MVELQNLTISAIWFYYVSKIMLVTLRTKIMTSKHLFRNIFFLGRHFANIEKLKS